MRAEETAIQRVAAPVPADRPRPLLALLVFVAVVFASGALLAPWLHQLVQQIAPNSHLAQQPFRRYVERCLLIIAVAGIYPLLRSLGVKSWRDVGLVNPVAQWRGIGGGFALGFASLVCVAVIALISHGRGLNTQLTAQKLLTSLIASVATAVLVSLVEEILFRGGIFNALRRAWVWPAALLASSMLYAMVHFTQKADVPGPVVWSSGFELLPRIWSGFGDWQVVIPGFFNLTLAGLSLGMAFQKTGNLWFSFGLHAGWIFWAKLYSLVTATLPATSEWFWGTGKLIDGWLALPVLALTFLALAASRWPGLKVVPHEPHPLRENVA